MDRQVPDSAGTATAFLTGVKTNYYTIGVNANIDHKDTDCDAVFKNKVPSIFDWASQAGKWKIFRSINYHFFFFFS